MGNISESQLFSCIDHTSLSDTDSIDTIKRFCQRTLEMQREGYSVAAVCIYPSFIKTTKQTLEGTGIGVATVAGAFPHGQLPLELKKEEVKYCINEGADEVDVVLNRGLFLSGNEKEAGKEIREMKECCSRKSLKVILETGEMPSAEDIRRASLLVMENGADFIKTSTGKYAVGATVEAARVMLNSIKVFYKNCNKKVGFKAAGGIKTVDEAVLYAEEAKKLMGEEYIVNEYFRIGTSRLTESLFSFLTL